MKYIRTKDLVVELETWMKIENDILIIGGATHKIVKQADTVEELCDEFVYVGLEYPKVLDTNHDFRQIDINQVLFNISLHGGCLYGAIWCKGEHNEPILKPVATMKGILPNGEIDWKLL